MVTVAGSEKAGKALTVGAGLVGAGVGVVSLLNQASAATANAPLDQKALYTASRMIGPDLVKVIVPSAGNFNLPPQGVKPFGWINGTTAGGVILLAINHFADGLYPGHQYVSPFLKGIGAGLTFGGAIGGIFDPPASSGGIRSGGNIPAHSHGSRAAGGVTASQPRQV